MYTMVCAHGRGYLGKFVFLLELFLVKRILKAVVETGISPCEIIEYTEGSKLSLCNSL